jgi:hypothetical protein
VETAELSAVVLAFTKFSVHVLRPCVTVAHNADITPPCTQLFCCAAVTCCRTVLVLFCCAAVTCCRTVPVLLCSVVLR